MKATRFAGIADAKTMLGQEIGISDWMLIDQERVNGFAQVTGDQQWIHVDVERARRESPFGGPIAHGYLTVSLLAKFAGECIAVDGIRLAVNYGLNRVRFAAPVKVGRIRARFVLAAWMTSKAGHRCSGRPRSRSKAARSRTGLHRGDAHPLVFLSSRVRFSPSSGYLAALHGAARLAGRRRSGAGVRRPPRRDRLEHRRHPAGLDGCRDQCRGPPPGLRNGGGLAGAGFSSICSSPLRRAAETAEIIARELGSSRPRNCSRG